LRLMVRGNLFFGNRFWARKTTLMFLWCEPIVNMLATHLVGLLHEIVDNHQRRFSTVSLQCSEDPGEILCEDIG